MAGPIGEPLFLKIEIDYDKGMTHKLIRLLFWFVLVGLVVVTLSPIGARPDSGLPVNLERALAFGVAGLLLGLSYPRRVWLALLLIIAFVVGLEALQHLTPDRHGHFVDVIWKVTGAVAGMAAGALGSASQNLRRWLRAA